MASQHRSRHITGRSRNVCRTIVWALAVVLLFSSKVRPVYGQLDRRLNVVLIMADDLGWTDLACYGSDLYETPHLDQLSREGMRFTQAYSACTVCSPTRAALMTGKYPARLHLTDWSPGQMPDNPRLLVPDWTKELPLEETTLAEALKSAGYATASIGKWHLGGEQFSPEKQGFDLNLAGTDKAAPPSFFSPYRIPNLTDGPTGEYLTDRLADEAAEIVTAWRDRPFFLFLPHFAVHTPIQGRKDLVKKYEARRRDGLTHRNAAYAAMVESLDGAVGRVLQTLEQEGLADRTLIVFTSDNGGRITKDTTSNAPLKYGKASAYEGGVRVPLIVRWPGVTKPDSIADDPVISMDLFRTILEACDIPVPESETKTGRPGCDGLSLVPRLSNKPWIGHEELFWHYPHHQHYQRGGTMPYSAIRSGHLKLIEFLDDLHTELYDLRTDISESKDLAADQPDTVARLRDRLHAWRIEVGAQMPRLNPGYKPDRPQYDPGRPQPPAGQQP